MTKRIAALLLLLALVLSGCSWTPAETEPPQPAIDYSYDTQTITCSEGYGLYSFRKDVDVMETGLAQYGFEKTISQAEREQFMEAAEAVLRELAGSEKPTFYVLSGYDGVCVQGNTLYTGLRDWESLDFITDVVLAAFGEFSHYGAAYGYASLLCDRLGWKSQTDAPFAPPQVTETADLNLLCFRKEFASEDVEAVKDLARGFAKAQGEENTATLLAGSSTAKGMEALCSEEETYQFLKEHPEDPYYYVCEFIEINGRPISYTEDFFDLQNVFAYSRGYTFPSDGNGYQTGSPFIGYLAETYGVREITQHYWGDHRELPKSHEALCADWAAYLKENYGQYSEYRP